jgi:hypothetical protein
MDGDELGEIDIDGDEVGDIEIDGDELGDIDIDGLIDGANEDEGLTDGEGDNVMTVGDKDGALLNPKIVGLFVTLFSLGPLLCRSSSATRYRSSSES